MLQDPFGRTFHYLRLSVTDACNYRCLYCLPDGYSRRQGEPAPLSEDELVRLVRGFAGLGVWKYRLTGGEPTLRRDFLALTARIAAVNGVERVALTTNGYKLREQASAYRAAGIQALNVSVNSLRPERYRQITGHDRLAAVLEGIEQALAAGFPLVKVNVVLLKGLNDDEVLDFVAWAQRMPVVVRFIELMPTEGNRAVQGRQLPVTTVANLLVQEGWFRRERSSDDGPAVEFVHPDAAGAIGYIAPYDKHFCSACNRLRVTSQGLMRLCLFGEAGASLRPWLQADEQLLALTERIQLLLGYKPAAHRLQQGILGQTPSFSIMGG